MTLDLSENGDFELSFDWLFVPLVVAKERFFDRVTDNRFGFPNPDIAETNRIAVILQADRQTVGMFIVLWRPDERRIPLKFEVIQNQYAVVQSGDIGRGLE